MAKKIKGTGSRKPPEPGGSHQELAEWMDTLMPDLQPVVRRLDQLIRKQHKALQYALKWKKAYYGLEEHGWIIELVAYDVSVNAVFHGGADFGAEPPLGDTGRSRYVKVKTVKEVETEEMKGWIMEAGKHDGWK